MALASLVVALVAWGSNATPAAACSCAAASDRELFESSHAVFTGTVSGYEMLGDPNDGGGPVVWTFAVDRVFKGEVAVQQAVGSIADGAACGLEVRRKHETFLVFASEPRPSDTGPEGPRLGSGLCHGSRHIDFEPVPAGFGEGEPPAQGPVVQAFITTPAWPVWGPAALALAAAVALVVLVAKLVPGRRRLRTAA